MAEIIAVVAAVSAFAGLADLCIKLSKSLNEMRETFVDTEGAITTLHADVDSFSSILRQIANRLELSLAKGRKYSLHEQMDLQNIINSCSTSLLSLQKVLCKFKDFSDLLGKGRAINIPVIKMRFRWVKEEKRIEKIQQSLEKQKSTLSVQLLVISVAQGDQLIDTLEQRLQNTSIAAAAAVSDIPAPTAEEIAVIIPALQLPDPPPYDPPIIPAVDATDTVEKDEVGVSKRKVSSTEDKATPEVTHGASLPLITLEDLKTQHQEVQLAENNSTEHPVNVKVLPNIADTNIKETLIPDTADNDQPSPTNDNGDQHKSDGKKSRSPGRKRVPLVLSVDALFSAIKAGNKQVVLQVMQSGVEATAAAPDGTTPLQLAVILNQEEIALTFLFFGVNPNTGGGPEISPLMAAINHGHQRLVKILLEAGADPSAVGVLWKAVTCSLEMVKLCLAQYPGFNHPVDINAFNRTDINGETPLSLACNIGKLDVARFLLEVVKADAAVMFKGSCLPQMRSPLHASITRKDEKLINLILTHLPDPNTCNDTRYGPGLLHCAISTGKLSILQLLVKAEVDVNVAFCLHGTALQVACTSGQLDMVEYLLECHADPNIGPSNLHPIEEVRCPLHVAVTQGSIPMANALLAAGANPELHKGTLWLAARTGKVEMVRRILGIDGLDRNALASDSWNHGEVRGTALHIAAQIGHADVLDLLLEEGADPNVGTKFLGTPLDVAIKNNHQRCVDILLGVGSDEDDDDGV